MNKGKAIGFLVVAFAAAVVLAAGASGRAALWASPEESPFVSLQSEQVYSPEHTAAARHEIASGDPAPRAFGMPPPHQPLPAANTGLMPGQSLVPDVRDMPPPAALCSDQGTKSDGGLAGTTPGTNVAATSSRVRRP